jgi:hypothetical protein
VNYKVVIPVVVLATFVAVFGYWMAGRSSEPADPGGELVAELDDGSEIWTGELDGDALTQAPRVADIPILWLGAKFEGYALTGFASIASGWVLVYGACRASPGPEPSCVPPIQVQIRSAGGIPPEGYFSPEPFRGVERTPGERGIRDGTESWVIWLPGRSTVKLYVSEYVVGDITEALMDVLSSANHEAMGYPEVGPGGSLAAMP